jgi:serine phosphatase RsbU (regulator of sigma subunit)
VHPASHGWPGSVDWRYILSSTLGGDAIGYHWVDDEHLALYLIDVTGHGLDSALLSVTITNVIRSGALAGADPRKPSQVLLALNEAFQGHRHGYKFFTLWYGVYRTASRTLTYASGGHPSAVAIVPGEPQPLVFPASGPVMGISPGVEYGAVESLIPPGARLFIFSDGVCEVRRDGQTVWNLPDCISYLCALTQREENVMDTLLAHVRDLRGSAHLDDDFSIIEVHLH